MFPYSNILSHISQFMASAHGKTRMVLLGQSNFDHVHYQIMCTLYPAQIISIYSILPFNIFLSVWISNKLIPTYYHPFLGIDCKKYKNMRNIKSHDPFIGKTSAGFWQLLQFYYIA